MSSPNQPYPYMNRPPPYDWDKEPDYWDDLCNIPAVVMFPQLARRLANNNNGDNAGNNTNPKTRAQPEFYQSNNYIEHPPHRVIITRRIIHPQPSIWRRMWNGILWLRFPILGFLAVVMALWDIVSAGIRTTHRLHEEEQHAATNAADTVNTEDDDIDNASITATDGSAGNEIEIENHGLIASDIYLILFLFGFARFFLWVVY